MTDKSVTLMTTHSLTAKTTTVTLSTKCRHIPTAGFRYTSDWVDRNTWKPTHCTVSIFRWV